MRMCQFPPSRIGDRGAQLAWDFVCFLEMAKLGGPGRRQKPANGGVGERNPVIGGIVSVQCFLNLSNWLGLVTGPNAFLEIPEIGGGPRGGGRSWALRTGLGGSPSQIPATGRGGSAEGSLRCEWNQTACLRLLRLLNPIPSAFYAAGRRFLARSVLGR